MKTIEMKINSQKYIHSILLHSAHFFNPSSFSAIVPVDVIFGTADALIQS